MRGFNFSALAFAMLAAALAAPVSPLGYRFQNTGSSDPRRTPGSRAHKRWKRARRAGERP